MVRPWLPRIHRRVKGVAPTGDEWDTITLLDTREGQPYLDVDNHRGYSCWRLMVKIPESRTYKSLGAIADSASGFTDRVKVTWPDRWLLARPSAAEPVIRLAAEAPTETEARSLVNRVLEVLSPGA